MTKFKKIAGITLAVLILGLMMWNLGHYWWIVPVILVVVVLLASGAG